MRVRPLRPTDRRARADRRPHVVGRPAESAPEGAATPEPEATAPIRDEHAAERRHRASVTPEDVAYYACACGFQFQASVSTSVRCPHCGSGQAW
jgi:hypothetical protein